MDSRTERRLTALIYSALLDPSRWQAFLDETAATIDGARVQIHGWTDAAGASLSATTGYDPAMLAEYERHLCRLNPWTQAISRAPVGLLLSSQQLQPEEKVRKSLFFEEWIRPQENIIAGAGVVIGRTPSGPFMFGGNVRQRDRETTHPKLIDVMGRLAPHLALAWRLARAISEPQIRLMAAEKVAVSSRAALILLRPDHTVVFADEAGEQILAAETLCRSDHLGRFSLRNPTAQSALEAAMHGLKQSTSQVALRSPRAKGCPPIHFIGLDYARAQDWPLAALLSLSRHSLLCVIEPSVSTKSASHLTSFGLTPAEQQIAVAVARGESTTTIAKKRGVTVTTVRSQMKAVYGKCDISNRAALAALVLGARS